MNLHPPFNKVVKTESELRSILGEPGELAQEKVIPYLDEHCVQFINQSPFVVLSTFNKNGTCDASPRGDRAGFTYIVDKNRLVIPERRGNKRADSLLNIMSQPSIGMSFFIPGLSDTLRVNGKAYITKDHELLNNMTVEGKNPLLGIGVLVEECFIHCGKAFKISKLWNSETWPLKKDLPSSGKIMAAHAQLKENSSDIEKRLEEGYVRRLY
ncbi:MSMEG_1061 family FMN-dependent PPOX-type flavoprotein [Halobacillus massiliensis]|uniref:MSMEG_1061 family FMN-dependent PPOX-type flavoprotein n=1 Tax=Halobacillus massiliensis TaxID=1926286 RepID=UPI0009E22327|nr:MSMEG_1061 family FMN-dependent PPOX-type flavoprotein [Halobacillus massiliensis]